MCLDKSQIQRYDDLCGYLAIVMLAYHLLAWNSCQAKDDRTLGDLFILYERRSTRYVLPNALVWLLNQLKSLFKKLMLRKSVVEALLTHFLEKLPTLLIRTLTTA